MVWPFIGRDKESRAHPPSPLHNIIYLTLGAGYAIGTVSDRAARYPNLAIGAGVLVAFVIGVFGGAEFINIHGVSEPDNWLHLVWGSATIWFGAKARTH